MGQARPGTLDDGYHPTEEEEPTADSGSSRESSSSRSQGPPNVEVCRLWNTYVVIVSLLSTCLHLLMRRELLMDDTHPHASWSKSCQWIFQGMTGPAYRPAAFKCLGMQYVIIAYDIITGGSSVH